MKGKNYGIHNMVDNHIFDTNSLCDNRIYQKKKGIRDSIDQLHGSGNYPTSLLMVYIFHVNRSICQDTELVNKGGK